MASGHLPVMQIQDVEQVRQGPVVYQRVDVSPDMFGAAQGRALANMGASLSGLAETLRKKQEEDDTNRVLQTYSEAKDRLRQELYDPDKGIFAQRGEAAVGAGAKIGAFSDQVLQDALDKLPTQKARDSFEKMWLRERDSTLDSVARHELSERETWKGDVTKGVITSAAQSAAAAYNNPEEIQRQTDEARRAIKANHFGKPPELIAAMEEEAISEIYKTVIERMVQDDPRAAQEFYEQNSSKISGEDHIAVGKMMAPALRRAEINNQFHAITGSGAAAREIIYGPELLSAIGGAESSFNPDAESPRGASGLMQVMPDTAREISSALGDGRMRGLSDAQVKQVLKKDTGLNLAYGAWYMQKQLEAFDGDLEAALIAYNAGPGNARKWLKAGRDYGVLPKRSETEPYVQKVMARYELNKAQREGTIARPEGDRFEAPGLSINYIGDPNKTYGRYATRNAKPFSSIVVHHTGASDLESSLGNLKGDPLRAGKSFGYHFYIDKDGSITQAAPLSARTNHVKGPEHKARVSRPDIANENAIGISLVGSGDATPAQIDAAKRLGSSLMQAYGVPPENVVGHGELQSDRRHTEGMAVATALRNGSTVAAEPKNARSSEILVAGNDGESSFRHATTVDTAEPDLEQWLAQADLIEDPDVRDKVKAKLSVEFNRRQAAKRAEQIALEKEGWRYITEEGGVDSIPPELEAKLGIDFMSKAYTYDEKISRRGKIDTDYDHWYRFNRMSDEEVAGMNIMDLRPHLDDGKMDQAINRQATIMRKGEEVDDEPVKGMRTRTQIVDATAKAVLGKIDSKHKMGQVAKLEEAVDREMVAFKRRTGKDPDATDIQAIVDRLMIDDKDRWFFQSGRRGFETDPTDLENFVAVTTSDEIPDRDYDSLVNRFQQIENRSPTEEEMVDVYNRAFRASRGGHVEPSPEERAELEQALTRKLQRAPSETELSLAYSNWLMRFLGP